MLSSLPSPETDPTYELPDLTVADEALAEVPALDEPGQGPYLAVSLPPEFLLADDSGAEDGPYLAADFVRDDETGAYVHQVQSRPTILRVVDSFDDDADLRCVAGDGSLWRYHVIPTS